MNPKEMIIILPPEFTGEIKTYDTAVFPHALDRIATLEAEVERLNSENRSLKFAISEDGLEKRAETAEAGVERERQLSDNYKSTLDFEVKRRMTAEAEVTRLNGLLQEWKGVASEANDKANINIARAETAEARVKELESELKQVWDLAQEQGRRAYSAETGGKELEAEVEQLKVERDLWKRESLAWEARYNHVLDALHKNHARAEKANARVRELEAELAELKGKLSEAEQCLIGITNSPIEAAHLIANQGLEAIKHQSLPPARRELSVDELEE